MNRRRTFSLPHFSLAVVMLLGWFAASNHCALGLMAGTAGVRKAHSCCQNGTPRHDKKPDEKRNIECCKSLHAVLHDAAKLPVAASLEIVALPVGWLVVPALAAPDEISAAPGTGPPPEVPTFAELVLHRSLRSHAPPPAA